MEDIQTMKYFCLDDATILAGILEISSSINTDAQRVIQPILGSEYRMYFSPAETTENINPRDMSIDQLRDLLESLQEGEVSIEKAVEFWEVYKAKLHCEHKTRSSKRKKEKTYPGVQVKRRRRLQIPWWIKLTKEYRSTLSSERSRKCVRKKKEKGKKP